MNERRVYARTSAQKHAKEYDYDIEVDGKKYNAQLMDISRGGANFRLLSFPERSLTGKVGVVKDDYYDYKYLKGVNYIVMWSQFNEMGIAFKQPLDEHTGALGYYSSRSA